MSGIDHLIPIAAFGRRDVCTEVDLDRVVRAQERPPWGAASIHGRFKRVGELLRSRAALTRQCLASAIPCALFAFYGLRLNWIPVYDFHSLDYSPLSPSTGGGGFSLPTPAATKSTESIHHCTQHQSSDPPPDFRETIESARWTNYSIAKTGHAARPLGCEHRGERSSLTRSVS
jgi:hypothetical protein